MLRYFARLGLDDQAHPLGRDDRHRRAANVVERSWLQSAIDGVLGAAHRFERTGQ